MIQTAELCPETEKNDCDPGTGRTMSVVFRKSGGKWPTMKGGKQAMTRSFRVL